ncbi:thiosulfate transporter TsuA-like [Corticium candelabrum]|uniref:thiosulfate transporter TsuA-like n=1 Tax=Corticium candelabrum TaxID=121492 RepID=UPI002E3283BF|nr:thiosulfate transporter TsuA-like [Corticium candelabrum]
MIDSPTPSSREVKEKSPLCRAESAYASSTHSVWRTIWVAAMCGLLFGWCVQKSNVYIPQVIFRQMKMEQFTMIKIFLSAVAASQVALVVLSITRKGDFTSSCVAYDGSGPHGILSTAVGAILLGAGMALSGACPGMVMAQIGTGLRYSGVILAGGLVGCIVYVLLEPILSKHVQSIWTLCSEKQRLSTWLDVAYWKLAVVVVVGLLSVITTLEVFLPYTIDYPYPDFYWTTNGTHSINKILQPVVVLSDFTWPPYVCGTIIGLLQIPLVLGLQDTLGSSSAWVTFVANIVYMIAPSVAKKSDYLMRSKDGPGNHWQVLYLTMVAIGAMLSALSSNMLINPNPPIESFNPIRSFFGGFLMLFGARMAGGCTSGHGISGFGLLYTNSIITVAFIFVGGIFTAFAMDDFTYGSSFFRVP